MSLFEVGRSPLHLPVHGLDFASEIVDTNGAGDTLVATFALALTAGVSMFESVYLAR
jgi:D-glycero-beta-D-manno-heptose-7-phosphate kinase